MESRDVPPAAYIPAERVITEMAEWGRRRIDDLSWPRVLTLGVIGGAFIAAGALFSLLLGSGIDSPGARLLVEGFGFSAGFFFVVLAEAALFTEANVVMPAALLTRESESRRVTRFWGLALAGNAVGAIIFGFLATRVARYSNEYGVLLEEIVSTKLSFRALGVGGWFEAVLSGVAANWLVGMAAFFATMGRTIFASTYRSFWP